MSGYDDDFEDRGARRAHGGPYTAKHPVPTVKGYREHRAEIKEQEGLDNNTAQPQLDADGNEPPSKTKRAYDAVKAISKDQDQHGNEQGDPYPTMNRNYPDASVEDPGTQQQGVYGGGQQEEQQKQEKQQEKSATETVASTVNPKEKRKAMKKQQPKGHGREVTDPVTHLPIMIHDMTDKNLGSAPENYPSVGSNHRTFTGPEAANKSDHHLQDEIYEVREAHQGMHKLFPPPNFHETKEHMINAYRQALTVGLTGIGVVGILGLAIISLLGLGSGSRTKTSAWSYLSLLLFIIGIAGAGAYALIQGVSSWLEKRISSIFEEQTWAADRHEEKEVNKNGALLPESAAWLNGLLAAVWPLINPDLFASIADMLEDVMQASLPKLVRMVSVDDIGQGSEAFRLLGVKWLPTGAAGKSVDDQGKLKDAGANDREVKGEGQVQGGREADTLHEGMEAEEGDFVNMELAFAYRPRSSGKSIASKAKHAHLYLKFYLPGGLAVPVWVELKGIVGIVRLRLQLTPDPPFFELCTLTFLGQPRVNLSCVPLSRHLPNLMDIPLISSFVQSAVDAALAEYVAPKSLTLDLKNMLVGDDFKKDTVTRGVVAVYIKKARGFKCGDGGFGPIEGSSDSYVTVSWGKVGKPMFSTRIIIDEQEPTWNEWAYILVSPDELNAQENLRIQIWDSDKHTADDDLGRVEVSLKELMHSEETKNKMHDREDRLMASDPDETMPGTISWAVGYFAKAHIQQSQLGKQTFDSSIRSLDQLKQQVHETTESKLREASLSKDKSQEKHQQEVQDFKAKEDQMIISSPPPPSMPSGILSIQIHNITGLEITPLNQDRNRSTGADEVKEDAAEQSDALPDSYCTIILNQRKIYRTRTKPKNAKPFFNAGTERFVKDWSTCEVIISVRDSREGEEDPLLGVVYLPLRKVFEHRSQVMGTFPLSGGIGNGRVRVSLVWRAVEMGDSVMGGELRGWDMGTVEVKGGVKWVGGGVGDDMSGRRGELERLSGCKLKLKTKIGKGKMNPLEGEEGTWVPKRHHAGGHGKQVSQQKQPGAGISEGSIFLGVVKRYQSMLLLQFRDKHSLLPDSNPALAVLWLSSIPDEEDVTVKVPVWKGGKKQLKRARSCADYNGLEEGEKPLGEVEFTVRFWRGLSGYHRKYAGKPRNRDVKGVMEVLDTVCDEKMDEEDDDDSDTADTSDSGSDSDSSLSDDEYNTRHNIHTPQHRDTPQEAATRKALRKHGDNTASSSSSSSDSDTNDIDLPDTSNDHHNPVSKTAHKAKRKLSAKLDGGKIGSDQDDGKRGVIAQVQDYKQHRKELHRRHRGVMQWKAARTLDWLGGQMKKGKGKVKEWGEHGDKSTGVETEV
ncbi:hypothetical protein QBC32DRAFT_211965 [Pseudoneurospora amorphoporcata]|uniref:Meiotically up-regulated gene 190 protein n=1 Tax=Pseudoneurospora amorphoporcata TaxID=241081 RepID=A0AAN6NX47_9PEZI|nr:hypothetical protein QBC32DRAFT_211965 [Pseudoneurospora amorphoporcata]